MLLERAPIGAVEAVGRLAGMQAQEPRAPFLGLWSRLHSFRDEDLLVALRAGDLLRGPLLRATLHLVTREDWSAFRAPVQPALTRALRGIGARAAGLDLDAIAAAARTLLAQEPRTAGELRALLHEAFPDDDERALGYAVRTHVPVVMVATGDRFGFPRDAQMRLAEPQQKSEDPLELIRRYLAAFGPASVADAQEWSGLAGLRAAFERLRPALASFTDERGRELFDLPDAPRPDPGTRAPARYLPQFDNLVLAHADRSRLIPDEHRHRIVTKNLRVNATALHDGEVCATWTVARRGKAATLELTPFAPLSQAARLALETEGIALLEANEPSAASFAVRVLDTPAG
jgi:hypothetical protein